MDFRSDNVTGACPEVMTALAAANAGSVSSYGDDDLTKGLTRRFQEIFETDRLVAFPVATGTAANSLALAQLTPPFGAVWCHANAHIEEDECGAPEFYTGGAKLVLLGGEHGRIDAADLAARLKAYPFGVEHHVQPGAVSLTQATESGTAYRPDDIAAIAEVCRKYRLGLHVDGARFANALAHLNCSAADLTWKAGVDVLSFGATKNGALAAEALVFFRPELATDFVYRRKRAGHLFSKMRFLSAQLDGYLDDGVWLRNARHANAMAARLAAGLAKLPGVSLAHPVEANEVFVTLPEAAIVALEAKGFRFHRWGGAGATTIRLVTAFNTEEKAVDAMVGAAGKVLA
ncbi:MAG TPA: low specificity L-threonine aldolase [Candidatus Cybelea sp.]|nr:low specificity L-threonine aldolase [Candidatus Cybelea sp.]